VQINEYKRAVKHFLENDVLIYNLMSKFGAIELKQRRNYFIALTTSIIGQQLSVKSARAIINRFISHFDNNLTPESLCTTDIETLRQLGLSEAKANYVKDLAAKVQNNEISLSGISNKPEHEIMELLTQVKGIGPWTVHMFLIFVLGKPNILPSEDLGIKKAIMLNYNLKILPTGEEVINISEKHNWAPFNSYASLYLWKSIDGE